LKILSQNQSFVRLYIQREKFVIRKQKKGDKFMLNKNLGDLNQRYSKIRVILHFICALIIIVISGLVIMSNSGEAFLEFGKISKVWSDSHKEILYIGDNIVIYHSAEHSLLDDFEREEQIQYELELEVLYYYAEKVGISVTDEQVKTKLITERKIAEYLVKKEDFNKLLNSLGMSEDEYWEWDKLFDITRKTLTVEKLLEHQRKIIEQKNENDSEIIIGEKLEKWRNDKIEEILEADNVKKIVN